MFNSILEDAMFEVRRHWKRRVFIPLAIIVIGLLIGGLVLGVTWLAANRAQPPDVNSEDIPLGSYAAGNIEVLNCIYQGPDECSNYQKSKDWISGSGNGSLTYTPVKGDQDAPGEKTGDGSREVSGLQALSSGEWHSVAAGMTKKGRASPGTVTENTVTTTDFDAENLSATASFTLPAESGEEAVKGEMTFTLKDSGVTLQSISYSEGGQ